MSLHDGNDLGAAASEPDPLADVPERFRQTLRLIPCRNDDGKSGAVLIHFGGLYSWS